MCEFPAMPLWTDAYLADTHPDLTLEQHGCYLVLLMAAWRRPSCSLPDDDAWFCRWLGIHGNHWRILRASVLERFFTRNEAGDWEQKRQRRERDFVGKKSTKARNNAEKRWHDSKENNNIADADAYASTPTPTPKQETPPSVPTLETLSYPTETHTDVAPSGANVTKLYAWEGRVIRLKERDYQGWKTNFAAVDLNAELQRLDDWLANDATVTQRTKWFVLVSACLGKRNRATMAEQHQQAQPFKPYYADWASNDPRWGQGL